MFTLVVELNLQTKIKLTITFIFIRSGKGNIPLSLIRFVCCENVNKHVCSWILDIFL